MLLRDEPDADFSGRCVRSSWALYSWANCRASQNIPNQICSRPCRVWSRLLLLAGYEGHWVTSVLPVNRIKHWKLSPSPALQLHFIYAVGLEFSFPIEIDPPKNLRVSDVTHSTGVVTWTPPAAQIDGYALTYQGQDGTSKVQWIPLSCRPRWNHPYDYGLCQFGLVGIWITEKQLWEGIYSVRSPGRESLRKELCYCHEWKLWRDFVTVECLFSTDLQVQEHVCFFTSLF